MADILERVNLYTGAKKKLEAIAKGGDAVKLTKDEAHSILDHIDWLQKENRSLMDSIPYDD